MPGSVGQKFDSGDAILAEYAVQPIGTWRHISYTVPHDTPYEPCRYHRLVQQDLEGTSIKPVVSATCLQAKEEYHQVIGGSKLSAEMLNRYEQVYNRADGREEVQRAKAIEEILMGNCVPAFLSPSDCFSWVSGTAITSACSAEAGIQHFPTSN